MKITRRRFLTHASLAACALPGAAAEVQRGIFRRGTKAKPAPAQPLLVFFGTDTTKPGAKGIYAAHFDPAQGTLTEATLVNECVRPSYFALAPTRSRHLLYVCNEGDSASGSSVSTCRFDSATGRMETLHHVPSGGAAPCYIELDASGRSAAVANYAGGSVATFGIDADGILRDSVSHVDLHGHDFAHHGPKADRQDGPHPHCANFSPDQRFLLVNDLGTDTILTWPIDAATGKLGAAHVNEVHPPGAGPRHLAFHPNGRWVYVINELGSTIEQYLWNSTKGDAAHGVEPQALLTDTSHSISTLDPGFKGTNTAAELLLGASGRMLYVSNRGEDSLAVFAIDEETGKLTLKQRIACGGKAPRHFAMEPGGHWLLCANQDSSTVTVFRHDEATGMLTGPTQTVSVPTPQFTLFA